MLKSYSMELAGRTLTLETGKMAGLANGSVLVKYGETTVLVNATASREPKEGIDFFPLSVEYNEKLYAVGKIPGGFTKREGKPSEKAILTSRAIDRPLRPLFPKDFRNDVCVVATVLSVEPDNSPEVAAMIGASVALSISDIPFGGPTAAVNVGYVDDKIVIERFFGLAGAEVSSYCGDREAFLGRYHGYGNPDGVAKGELGGELNYNENGCGALAARIFLQPGETRQIAFVLGMKEDAEAERILNGYQNPEKVCQEEWEELVSYWHEKFSHF